MNIIRCVTNNIALLKQLATGGHSGYSTVDCIRLSLELVRVPGNDLLTHHHGNMANPELEVNTV